MATDRAVKMTLGIDLDPAKAKAAAGAFGTAVKGAIGVAMTAGIGLAARSSEFRQSLAGAFAGVGASLKGSLGGFMNNLGVSASTAGSLAGGAGGAVAGAGRFAINHPRLAGMALGGLGGGIPGMLGGAAPNFGRFLASSGGAAIGGALAGPAGAIGGAAGGLMGGVGGAAIGIAVGGAVAGVTALGKAAMESANMLAGLVELTDPGTAKEWQRAVADASAMLGDTFKPMLEAATGILRTTADTFSMIDDGAKELVGSLSGVVKTSQELFVNVLKPVLPIINLGLKAMALGVSALTFPLKKLGEGVDWVVSKIPFLNSKGASVGVAGNDASFTSIDEPARAVQLAAARHGKMSDAARQLMLLEEIARNTASTDRNTTPNPRERLNSESLGGRR